LQFKGIVEEAFKMEEVKDVPTEGHAVQIVRVKKDHTLILDEITLTTVLSQEHSNQRQTSSNHFHSWSI